MMTSRIRVTAMVIALISSSWSSAATLVDFKPLPSSPGLPEFVFDGPFGSPSFQTGPGAHGNPFGDGNLPVAAQNPGGLDSEASFVIPAIPGGNVHPPTTEFYDSTLIFNGLVAVGAPVPFGGTLLQQLGPGSFDLLSTDLDGPGLAPPVLLLHGDILGATYIVGTGDAGAAFNSGTVNYTAGVIYNALVGTGANPNNNSMSISMADVTPVFGIGPDGFLAHFTANGTGLFNFNPVPEPTSLLLLTLGVAGLTIARRR